MAEIKEKILSVLSDHNGLTDREITNIIYDSTYPQQAINSTCNAMNRSGLINRVVREDGKIGNFILGDVAARGRDAITLKRVETPNPADFQQHGWATVSLRGIDFIKVELAFQYFNRSNVFAELTGSTLRQTLAKPKYSKYATQAVSGYSGYLESSIGSFLAFCKANNDSLYKNFLNPYGDDLYCKFALDTKEILDEKGLYFYKFGEEILYIGRCKDSFRKRMNQGYGCIHPKNCYRDGQSTNCHINSLINRLGAKVELFVAVLRDDASIEANERILIKAINPCWNIALKN